MDGIRKGERHGSNMRRLVLFLAFVTSHGATHTFGGTDALGWTDSASYEGSQYTVSRVTATVARETAITAATLGIGTAARGGSAAAQAAYKGILVTEAATGGYQIGKGAGQIAEGDYESGALNVVAGSLRVGGSIVSAGAIAPTTTKVYRQGTFADEATGWEGNYVKGKQWANENPLTTPDYAKRYGLPAENTAKPDWVVGGNTTGAYSKRPAPASHNNPLNTGGGTEILPKDPTSVRLNWFHMP